MFKSVHGHIRDFALVIGAKGFKLHKVIIDFIAKSLASPETFDTKKHKLFEANFQWKAFKALVSDEKEENWYIYSIVLAPWGERTDTEAAVYASDSTGKILDNTDVGVTVEELEKSPVLSKYLKGPLLKIMDLPVSAVTYINSDKKKYDRQQFIEKFENFKVKGPEGQTINFYILLQPKGSKELKTPFGADVNPGTGEK
jgi:hypothetical protein